MDRKGQIKDEAYFGDKLDIGNREKEELRPIPGFPA